MSAHETTCEHCGHLLLWLDCPYPFWYHAGATPRHGDWVPDHGCVADATLATDDDVEVVCE